MFILEIVAPTVLLIPFPLPVSLIIDREFSLAVDVIGITVPSDKVTSAVADEIEAGDIFGFIDT